MSSHHFVKEGQEPALIIAEPVSFSTVEPLLEWAPFIIVFEQAIDEVLRWDIKIDAIVLYANSEKLITEKALHQMPYQTVIVHDERTMLNEAARLLISRKQLVAHLCVETAPPYFDQCQRLSDQMEIAIIGSQLRWSPIPHGSYKKWLPLNDEVFIHGAGPFEISGKNHRTGSQTAVTGADALISVTSASFFWVGESLN